MGALQFAACSFLITMASNKTGLLSTLWNCTAVIVKHQKLLEIFEHGFFEIFVNATLV